MVVWRQATAVRGGHRWSWMVEKKVLGFGWAFREDESEKKSFLHVEECIYNLQISLSELVSLSGSPLFTLSTTPSALSLAQRANSRSAQFPLGLELRLARPFALSVIPYWVGIALSAPFALSKTSKVVIFITPTVKLWRIVLGTSSHNLKTIQRLTNPGSQFYWNWFRQNLKSHNFNLAQQNST